MSYFIPNENEEYIDYIQRILNNRENIKIGGVYMELHHIKPRCKNGDDSESNLIYLYPQEHYYAHKLLALENPEDDSLLYAWWMMSNKNNTKCTADEYAQLKEKFIEIAKRNNSGKKNPFYNKQHSEEFKQNISNLFKDKPKTKEHREKLSQSRLGRFTGEDNPFFNKHHTQEAREINRQKHNPFIVQCVETGEIYPSMKEAHRKTGVNQWSLNKCIHGEKETAGGYHWKRIF